MQRILAHRSDRSASFNDRPQDAAGGQIYFFLLYSEHQPFGLIAPSTTAQLPGA
jgi:hypothetical protein